MQRTRSRRARAAGPARASPGFGASATQDNLDGEFGSPRPPRRQRAEGYQETRVAQDAAAAAEAAMGAEAAADSGRSRWRATVGLGKAAGARVSRVTRQK